MTMLMLTGPLMGMPDMNIGKMLSGVMGIPIAIGWLAHAMVGTGLAIIYAYAFSLKLPAAPWLKGALFSFIPWLVKESMLSPMMGTGFFESGTPAPLIMAMGGLMGHLVYGIVLGTIYGNESPTKIVATA
jgi:hypothetical protein